MKKINNLTACTVIMNGHSDNLADPRVLPIWGNSIHI